MSNWLAECKCALHSINHAFSMAPHAWLSHWCSLTHGVLAVIVWVGGGGGVADSDM